MSNNNVKTLRQSDECADDPLTSLLRQGARQLIEQAVEAELQRYLEEHSHIEHGGKKAIIRNGFLPEREIQTGIGSVPVRIPKVRDRSGQGHKFNSLVVPPYLKRTSSIDELLPWLYLKGVSTGDFQEALQSILGKQAENLSPGVISRLKARWVDDYKQWRQRSLQNKHYVYVWADGIHFNIRSEESRQCILVLIGVTDHGKKELIAIEDGYRESADSWEELLAGVEQQGLTIAPKLAIGDGALGFWKAVSKRWPDTRHQRCWVHKTANVLNKLPKSAQSKVKSDLHDIWQAETREKAHEAFDKAIKRFEAKYPKAMECLSKGKEQMLAFYDFPAEHWVHIRTTNPIESTFATVRLRTAKTRGCVSRESILSMVFKLTQSAQKGWRKLRGFKLLADVVQGICFKDGVRAGTEADREVA
ncbi:IS256 family transposase [Endozoicomonas atrinae]|uniref:IS256 family transposase n=1 Tax=Endozoicomonas atrinae TaxID=1333660 RepID=UPI003AFF67FB